MGAHRSSEGVQNAGCCALRDLTANHAPNKVALAAHTGIAVVVVAMGVHKSSMGAQKHGCVALRNLMVNAEKKVAVAARRGIEAVVSAMGAHVLCAVVQTQG